MTEQLVDAFVAVEDVAAFRALEVLDPFQVVELFAGRADRRLAGADFADLAEVEARVDAPTAEPRPGGVVAVVAERGAAVDRLAVADRDREEEVGAFAAVEQVGAAVVDQRVVAGAAVERVDVGRRRVVDEDVFARPAVQTVSAPAPPSPITETPSGKPAA